MGFRNSEQCYWLSKFQALRKVANVRVVQRGNGVSFAAKTFAEVLGANFDGYIPAQARVTRAIHFAHPASADGGSDFIRAKLGARCKCHTWRGLYTYFLDNGVC